MLLIGVLRELKDEKKKVYKLCRGSLHIQRGLVRVLLRVYKGKGGSESILWKLENRIDTNI